MMLGVVAACGGKTAVWAVHCRRRFEGPTAQRGAWRGRGFRSAIFQRHGIEARRTCLHSGMHYTGARGIRGEDGVGGARPQLPAWPHARDVAAAPACGARRSVPSRAGMAASGSRRMAVPSTANPVRPEPCDAFRPGDETDEVGAQGPAWPGGALPRLPALTALPARSPPPKYTYMAHLRPRFDERDKARAAARRQRPRLAAKGRCGAAGGEAGAEVRRAV